MLIRRLSLLVLLSLGLFASCAAQIYSNGPTNGTVGAYFIDGPGPGPFSQSISDGFIPASSGTIAGFSFGEWVPAGTTPTTVSWSIGFTVFGSQIAFGVATPLNFTFDCGNGTPYNGGTCAANKGYDVYDVLVTASGSLTANTVYYLTLGGANDSAGTQFDAWDINGGAATCTYALSGTSFGPCGAGTNQTWIHSDDQGEAFTIYAVETPEPSALVLLGSGIWSIATFHGRRGKRIQKSQTKIL